MCPDVQIVGLEYVENAKPTPRITLVADYLLRKAHQVEVCLVILESE